MSYSIVYYNARVKKEIEGAGTKDSKEKDEGDKEWLNQNMNLQSMITRRFSRMPAKEKVSVRHTMLLKKNTL